MKKHIKTSLNEFLSTNFIYHGTHKGATLNIQKDGYMKPSNNGEKLPSISFTDKIKYAEYYALAKGGKDKMVVLRTPISDDFSLSTRIQNNKGYEYITYNIIPIDKLEILTPNNSWVYLKYWDVVFNEPL